MLGHVHDIVAPLLPKAVPQIFIPAAAVIGILFAIFTWWRGALLYGYAPVLSCRIALVPRPSARASLRFEAVVRAAQCPSSRSARAPAPMARRAAPSCWRRSWPGRSR
jgi:hypothetical protein